MAVVRWSIIWLGILVAIAHRRAAADLIGGHETRCQLTVKLVGPIATVTEVHDLVAGPDAAPEAVYDLGLPVGAVVIDARITPPGGRAARAVAVATSAIATETPAAAGLGLPPDLGLVRWRGRDADGEHLEARVTGLDAQRALRLTIAWTAPAAYRDGRLVLRVPARGVDGGLGRCEVAVQAKPGGGVRSFGPAFVNGEVVAARGGRVAVASVRALEVELVPTWSSAGPVAATAAVVVGGGGGDVRTLTTVAVYVPPARGQARFSPRRLVVLVDTSRSLGPIGRAASSAIVDALIGAVPASTPVEVIGFDREARRLLGAWVPAGAARDRIAGALRAAVPAGGSDLGAALNLAATVVGDGEPAAIVIVTDGILPTAVDGADLLGHATMPVSQVTIDAIVPLVPGAPLIERGAIDALVTVFHGQLIAVRTTELDRRAARLARDLASAPPLRDLAVTLDGERAPLGFPDQLRPGDGAIAHVLSRGRPAKQVRLVGARSADAVSFDAVALARGAAPLAIAAAAADAVALDDVAALADAELLELGRAHRVVTAHTALAIVDTSTALGATRAELARTAGVFTRTSPSGRALDDAPVVAVDPVAAAQPDGNHDRAVYQVLIKYQLWPQLRACYQDALRGQPRFAGTLDLTLELARGEVHDVRIGGSHLPAALIGCVATAAYAMQVPVYPLDGIAETIAIVHQPVVLRAPIDLDGAGAVEDELGAVIAEPAPPPR